MSNNEAPTDSLDLFLRDATRRPLLTAAQEVELTELVERGDAGARQTMIESNLRLVVSIAKIPPPGPPFPRPDPGGRDRLEPRGRQVRLAAGLRVLDLRPLVDSAGGLALDRRPGEDDPHSHAHRRAPAQGCSRRPNARARTRPRAEPGGARRGNRFAARTRPPGV